MFIFCLFIDTIFCNVLYNYRLIKNQKVKALYNNNLLRDFVGSAKNGPKFNFHQYQGYNDVIPLKI